MNLQHLLSLQAVFYIVAIITMILHSTLLLILVILLFSIKRKISNISTVFDEKFETMKTIFSHPKETATVVGEAVAGAAIGEAAKLFKRDKNEDDE